LNSLYIEENINCYDSFITHLNSNSFIFYEEDRLDPNNVHYIKYPSKGILIGSKENDTLLSFKYDKVEMKIDKEGIVESAKQFNKKSIQIRKIQVMELKERKKC
jgi:uncharacterized protein YdeI (YjbR/CyaY-like superfamily)